MSKKKYIKGKLMLLLRRWGMLCKKTQPKSRVLRIKQSLMPDGTVLNYTEPILAEDLPTNTSSINSEVHIWVEWKKGYNKDCKFDAATNSCVCGKTVEQFSKTQTCKQ
jgi:hypothetical protein